MSTESEVSLDLKAEKQEILCRSLVPLFDMKLANVSRPSLV
jgi:hypothetical protein